MEREAGSVVLRVLPKTTGREVLGKEGESEEGLICLLIPQNKARFALRCCCNTGEPLELSELMVEK